MAQKVLILGSSGSGKSTSLRNLNPKETFVIKCVEKPLPFKGSEKNYNVQAKNVFTASNLLKIMGALDKINSNKEIKTLVIDDFNYMLTFGYKDSAKEVGFSKFERLAFNTIDVLQKIDGLRKDLTVYIMAHTQKDSDGKISMKTIGRFLDEKVVIEGLFSIVILALGSENDYKFTVNGTDPAKSPMGMFAENDIDNDLTLINKAIDEYFN